MGLLTGSRGARHAVADPTSIGRGLLVFAALVWAVACPGTALADWHRTQALAPAAESTTPQVAVAGADALVAWVNRRPEAVALVRERRGASGAWQRARVLAHGVRATVGAAAGPGGRAVVLVARASGLEAISRGSRHGTWSSALLGPGPGARGSLVVRLASGGDVVVWSRLERGSWAIRSAYRDGLGAEWKVSRAPYRPPALTGEPQLALGRGGAAVIAWAGALGEVVVGRRAETTRRWAPAQVLARPPADGSLPNTYAQVTSSARGDAAVSWGFLARPVDAGPGIQAVALRLRGSSAWGPATSLDAAGGAVPGVALDEHGNAAAIWVVDDASVGPRFEAATRAAAAATWDRGPAFPLADCLCSYGVRPLLLAGGTLVAVASSDSLGGPSSLFSIVRRGPAGPWGTRYDLPGGTFTDLQATASTAGGALVAWADENEGAPIRVARYSP